MKYIKYLILSFLITIGGCSLEEKVKELKEAKQKREKASLKFIIHEVTLKDGTRCAVLYSDGVQNGRGGISCDWR